MFRLKTLGTLALDGATRPIPAAALQKRRLALLAIVASHGSAGIPRDKAALLLWPESDSESARHSLSQLLYSIRQVLHADPFLSTSGTLRFRTEIITSDLDDLDAAVKSNQIDRVAELYMGKFLDGFSLPDSVEFERWTDAERARRNSQVIAVLEKHASMLSLSGRHTEAAEWWKKLTNLEPLDSRLAAELIKSLDAAGNRPGALHHANLHSSLVRDELEIEPDPVVASLERYLRTPATSLRAVAPIANGRDEVIPQPGQNAEKKHTGWRVVAGVVALIAVGGLASASIRSKPDGHAASGTAVAVLPFSIHGDSSIEYLHEGIVGLLSSDLNGAGDLRAVDPRALLRYSDANPDVDEPRRAASLSKHFGAGLFVLGDVSEAGGKLRISAQLFNRSAPTSALSSAVVEGARTQLFELVDKLASNLVAGRYQGPRERLTNSAAVTTRSFPAFKEYLAGEQEFRSGHYSRAVQAFERATALDTTFALAYYRMSVAAEWEGRPDLQSKAATRALALSSRLSDHDRKLVEALAARRERNPDKAESIYRHIVAEFPDDTEAWYQFGEVLFHDNAMRGRSFIESRTAWEHVLKFVPNDVDALLHLTRVLARTGPRQVFDSVVRVSLPFLTPAQKLETESLRAFTIGSSTEQDSLLRELRSADDEVAWQSLWRVATYSRNIEGAERIAGIFLAPPRSTASKAIGHTSLMILLLAQGKVAKAAEQDSYVPRAFPWSKNVGNIYFRSLGFTNNDSLGLRRLRSAFDTWDPPAIDESQLLSNPQRMLAPQFKLYSAGLVSVALNETATAKRYASRIRQTTAPIAAGSISDFLAMIVDAAALRQEGKTSEALTLLESWRGTIPIELGAALGAESYYGWLRAELLNESSRDLDALRWYESRSDLFINELIYLAPASLRAATIYDQRGERMNAITAYRTFIGLWKHADPELQPYVSRARERLRILLSST